MAAILENKQLKLQKMALKMHLFWTLDSHIFLTVGLIRNKNALKCGFVNMRAIKLKKKFPLYFMD